MLDQPTLESYEVYERSIAPFRHEFAESPVIRSLGSTTNKKRLHLFLYLFASYGFAMTQPVAGWIRRAGERTIEVGYEEIGKTLIRHAAHEAGHERMMTTDAEFLKSKWSDEYREPLPELDPPKAVSDYRDLHETTIESSAPFAQIAIELEIEALSINHGAELVSHWIRTLGKEFLPGLTFLTDHVELDKGHTHFNQSLLQRLLARSPEVCQNLVSAGSQALITYNHYLQECWTQSQASN